MFPVLFRIGAFEITSFGVMVALGALAGSWLFGRELEARGLGHASSLAVRVAGGLTVAQYASPGLLVVGLGLLLWAELAAQRPPALGQP